MKKKKKNTPTDVSQLDSYICDVTTLKDPDTIECIKEKVPASVAPGCPGEWGGDEAGTESRLAGKRKPIARKTAETRRKKAET